MPAAGSAAIDAGSMKPALAGLALSGVALGAGFLVTDPYALLDFDRFRADVEHLSDYTQGSLLLGETQSSGHVYYLWSLGWGLGVAAAIMAAAGAVVLSLRDRAAALVLLPGPLIFFAYVGAQERHFARYVMPLYPVLCLLAGVGVVWLASTIASRAGWSGRRAAAVTAVVAAIACAQGLVYVIHNNIVLTREDTRTATREWMVDNIPAGTQILVEPLVPKEWYRDGGLPIVKDARFRWDRFVRNRADIDELAKRHPRSRSNADFANYTYTLFPGLLDFYRSRGVCWIVSGSGQSGRAFNNPERVPAAIDYYQQLASEATLRFSVSPFGPPGAGPRPPLPVRPFVQLLPAGLRAPGAGHARLPATRLHSARVVRSAIARTGRTPRARRRPSASPSAAGCSAAWRRRSRAAAWSSRRARGTSLPARSGA